MIRKEDDMQHVLYSGTCLSRVLLDTGKPKTRKALTCPSLFHGAIERSFEGPRKRRLWRIDSINGKLYALIVSGEAPDLSGFASQFGFAGDPSSCATKEYGPFLHRLEKGQVWRFKVKANPVRGRSSGKGGKAHIGTEFQKRWLMDKAKEHGFALDEDAFDITEREWISFRKNTGDAVSMLAVTYEGVLTVTDPALFRSLLVNGLGREKAYGLGMMTIVRA